MNVGLQMTVRRRGRRWLVMGLIALALGTAAISATQLTQPEPTPAYAGPINGGNG
jgi:hypothetical protein